VPPPSKYARDPVLVALGRAIRRARKERAISQERLALDTEIDRSYMGAIERGEQNAGVMHLARIAAAMDMFVWELFIDAESNPASR
jgi:transcriptional regulator with XRE-family HTH domain